MGGPIRHVRVPRIRGIPRFLYYFGHFYESSRSEEIFFFWGGGGLVKQSTSAGMPNHDL